VIPTASQETIQAAYRSLIARYHPDKVASLGPELQAVANARTKEINFAYDILNDAVSRARYDEELRGEDRVEVLTLGPASRPKSPGVKTPCPAGGAFRARHRRTRAAAAETLCARDSLGRRCGDRAGPDAASGGEPDLRRGGILGDRTRPFFLRGGKPRRCKRRF